ncbi:MAG: hypothetical protein ACXABU_03710 [Candidatus Hodarchaeales archaeon]
MGRINVIVIMFIIIQGLTVINEGNSTDSVIQQEKNSSSYDLNYSYVMNSPELTFNRIIVLSRNCDKLFLNLSVQNYGEPIDTVLTSVKINNVLTEQAFSSIEREGLKNCIVYQFDQPQFLIIPLNYSYQEILSISISLHLDSLISWREVEYNFAIFSAILYSVNLVEPLNNQSLMIFSNSFQFALQPSRISSFGKRLLLKSFIPVEIPDNMYLSSILEITMSSGRFDYVTVSTGTNYAIDGNFVRINSTVNRNNLKNQIWHLNLYIIPIIDSQEEYSLITFSLQAYGILKEKIIIYQNLDLINHPIPGIIMTPVLILLLFGIPYYYVYQEELTEKDDRIIESELGRV